MVELIIVLVLIGTLSLIVIPRINVGSMQVTPVAEQIAAEVRYAQNLAMTRSQAHVLEFGTGSMTLRSEDARKLSGGPVRLSDGSNALDFRGLSVAGPNEIRFSSRFGQPDWSGSIEVSGGASVVGIRVEAETGYVSLE